jgi:hypothetical protein
MMASFLRTSKNSRSSEEEKEIEELDVSKILNCDSGKKKRKSKKGLSELPQSAAIQIKTISENLKLEIRPNRAPGQPS